MHEAVSVGAPAGERPRGSATGDPVTLEIIRGAIGAAQSEMEALIERTAMSDVIREKKDFFAGYFDPAGRLVTGTPLPLAAYAEDARRP